MIFSASMRPHLTWRLLCPALGVEHQRLRGVFLRHGVINLEKRRCHFLSCPIGRGVDGNESSGAGIDRVGKRHACRLFSKIIARLGSIPAVSFIGTWLFGAMLFPSAFWATSLCGYFSLSLPLRAFSPTSRSFILDTQLSLQTRLFRPWTRVAYFTCWS